MKTIKNWTILALSMCGLAATIAFADDNLASTNSMPTTLTEQQFVSDAAVGGMKEVYLSELALDRSQNTRVRDLAQRMVKDHRAANRKLEKIANGEGLNLPATNTFSTDDPTWRNPQIDDSQVVKGAQLLATTNLPYRSDYLVVQSLKASMGNDFDRAYVNAMIDDHAAAVAEFEKASQTLTDEKLKKFADKTLPTLRHHAMMVQQLNTELNASGTIYMSTNNVDSSAPKRPYIAPVP